LNVRNAAAEARFSGDDAHKQVVWRFVNTGTADPFYNMALDEAIVKTVEKKGGPPTIRAYAWKPAAVSIGYFQNLLDVVDAGKCVRLGIPLVRRLTGGRAVFHDEEVTYSVIAKKDHLEAGQSIQDIYRRIGQALVASLRYLKIKALLSRPTAHALPRRIAQSPGPCFSSTGRYEVLVEGRKVVGSAQRWLGDVVLQHGSVLTGEGHLKIVQLLPAGQAAEREQMAQELRGKTISLGALLSRPVAYTEVTGALFCGFGEILGVPLEKGRLLAEEEALARCLVRERYGCPEWTLLR
jgi:lipoate-protein ligase A